jgi:hypothetical protein
MQQQLQAAAAELGDKRMEYEGKRADLLIKERELAIREFDAETKRLQVVGAGMTPEQVQTIVLDTMKQVATPPAPIVPPVNEAPAPSGGPSPREEPSWPTQP